MHIPALYLHLHSCCCWAQFPVDRWFICPFTTASIQLSERVHVSSTDRFTYRNNTIFYADAALPSNVMTNNLTVYNGISKTTYTGFAPVQFQGQGVTYVDTLHGVAFYIIGAYLVVNSNDFKLGHFPFMKPALRTLLEEKAFVSESVAEVTFGQGVTAIESANITILCSVIDGTPPPVMAFQFNGSAITTSNSKYTVVIAQNIVLPNTSSLTIHNLGASDEGVYNCSAVNIAGRAVAETSLTVNAAG